MFFCYDTHDAKLICACILLQCFYTRNALQLSVWIFSVLVPVDYFNFSLHLQQNVRKRHCFYARSVSEHSAKLFSVLVVYSNFSLQLQQRLEFQRITCATKLMPSWILSMAHIVQIFTEWPSSLLLLCVSLVIAIKSRGTFF